MSEENKYTFENEEYRKTYWHTCSHVLAQAVKRLWPEVKLAIGPSIDGGFYYDLDAPFAFTQENLAQIEAEMRKICKEKLKLERFELPREEALKFMEEKGEPYKVELIEDLPEGERVPEGRVKPWGTAQAVLAARHVVDGPFAVVNADDYYGKEAFVQLHSFLQGYTPAEPGKLSMAGFVLKNTLSDNGAVTRGICQMNDAHYLTGVLETGGIEKTADGAAAGGKSIDIDSLVSMNMWALTPEFVDLLESGFVEFFEKAAPANPLKAEYLLPIYIDELLHADKVSVKVLPTHDKWFGVTYAEDKQTVIDSFARLVADGVYKKDLFSDLKK